MSDQDKCRELGMFGRMRVRCDFVARYDSVPMTVAEMFGGTIPHDFSGRLPEKKTYVHDICTACGKKVIR